MLLVEEGLVSHQFWHQSFPGWVHPETWPFSPAAPVFPPPYDCLSLCLCSFPASRTGSRFSSLYSLQPGQKGKGQTWKASRRAAFAIPWQGGRVSYPSSIPLSSQQPSMPQDSSVALEVRLFWSELEEAQNSLSLSLFEEHEVFFLEWGRFRQVIAIPKCLFSKPFFKCEI